MVVYSILMFLQNKYIMCLRMKNTKKMCLKIILNKLNKLCKRKITNKKMSRANIKHSRFSTLVPYTNA